MVKFQCLLACVIVMCAVKIVPQLNELTTEEFDKIKDHPDFKQLKKDHKIIMILDEDEDDVPDPNPAPVVIDPAKMKVAELREYATSLGIEVPEGAKKDEIQNLIAMMEEE